MAHGSWSGAPGQPYLAKSNASEYESMSAAAVAHLRPVALKAASLAGVLRHWCVTSIDAIVRGTPLDSTTSAASGSTYSLKAAAGVMFPFSDHVPRIET